MKYRLVYTQQARKDARKLRSSHLAAGAKVLLELISENPYVDPPPYEALVGDLNGAFSRRLNTQHRLVYQVLEGEQVVKVLRLWTHYS